MHCPVRYANDVIKNGIQPKNNKQKYLCKKCHRQFVLEPEKHKITDTQKELIDKLLLERISLAGICRVVGVSERWLQYYVNDKYAQTPRVIKFSGTSTGELVLECDELWSYVENSKKTVGLARLG